MEGQPSNAREGLRVGWLQASLSSESLGGLVEVVVVPLLPATSHGLVLASRVARGRLSPSTALLEWWLLGCFSHAGREGKGRPAACRAALPHMGEVEGRRVPLRAAGQAASGCIAGVLGASRLSSTRSQSLCIFPELGASIHTQGFWPPAWNQPPGPCHRQP